MIEKSNLVILIVLLLFFSQTSQALTIKGIKLSHAKDITFTQQIISLDKVKLFDENSKREKINEIKKFGKKKTLTGDLNIIIHDDFENRKSEIEYSLTTEQGETYIVYPSSMSPLDSSITTNIQALAIGNEIVPVEISPIEKFTTKQPTRNPNLGNQRLAVILVNFIDNPSTPITKEEVRDKIFNENNFNSLNYYIKETSYNKAYVSGDVFGLYTLPFDSSEKCLQGGFDKVLNASINASDPYVDFSEYNHLMIILVNDPGCSSSANLGKTKIQTSDGLINLSISELSGYNTLEGVRTTAHEFGHQLGLRHANSWECGNSIIGKNCSSIDYADIFDVMGYSAPEGQYNSFHKEMLGWLEPSEIVKLEKNGIYIINPLELPGGIKMLKLQTNKNFYYSIEYRRPIGHDAILSDNWGTSVYNGGIIHTNLTNINFGYDTQLLDTTPNSENSPLLDIKDSVLVSGKSFTDSENNITIKVIRATAKYLEICFGQTNCRI